MCNLLNTKQMKKLLVLMAAVAMTLTAAAQQEEAYPSYVQVYGSAEQEITPDEIDLSITINERDSKGKITVEQQQREMVAALKKLGIDVEKQLRVVDLSSTFFKRNTSVATAQYRLCLHDAATVARAWQALDGLGISQVSVARLSHSKMGEYRVEVRKEAIRAARQKAVELAEAIGQQVGKCFYIFDTNSEGVPVYKSNVMMARASADTAVEEAADPALEFQTIKLSYRVQAKFVLE